MPVDIEVLVTKIFGYFHIHVIHVESLKDFCDFAGQEYNQILCTANVRWLSLLPTLERVLKFTLRRSFSYVRNTVFKSIETVLSKQLELWLSCVHSQPLFFS
jgi:hypothetical protein